MSTPSLEPSSHVADETVVRDHAEELRALADRHSITKLRFAGPGRLVGHVEQTKDLLDVAGFDAAASDLLGASVMLLSDAVLDKPNVSPDLVAARPL